MTQDAPDAGAAASDVPARPSMDEAEMQRYIDERFGAFDERLQAGDKRMENIEKGLAQNTLLTGRIHAFLEGADAGLKVLGWLGSAAVWLAKFVAPFMTLWALFHGGSDSHHPPPK